MNKKIEISERGLFKFFQTIRVHYADTDAQQIVYYGSYFTYMETGRQEYWRKLGIRLKDMWEQGIAMTIVEADCRYLKPASYDDVLDVHVRTSRLGRHSVTLEFLIIRRSDDAITAMGKNVFVAVAKESWKPTPIPDWFRKATERFEGKRSKVKGQGVRRET